MFKSRYFLIPLAFLCLFRVQAQLGFCEGNKGDPIFQEDFGTGEGTGQPLKTGVTTYSFVTGDPQDGQYTISSFVGNEIPSWHSYFPSQTNSNGKALIVNADYSAGKFYEVKISGLCEATTYQFSAYLINIYDRASGICENGGIPINVRFEIWDETNTNLLKKGSTGDIASTNSPIWKQYALTFQSEPSQAGVILKMYNNSGGGCGNDLAIDDIVFRSCGDKTDITSPDTSGAEIVVCPELAPKSTVLTANPDFSVYKKHAFQWQNSEDAQNWEDVPNANMATYKTPQISLSRYYRVKVAEDKLNLNDNLCSSVSNPFYIHILKTPNAPVSAGNVTSCDANQIPPLVVHSENDETVNWYASATASTALASGEAFTTTTAGIYYAEAVKTGYSCLPSSRTPVTLTLSSPPNAEDETIVLCPEASISLDAGNPNMEYLWDTGETSESIIVSNPGIYKVIIMNLSGCSATKTFTVSQAIGPVIKNIVSNEKDVTIIPETEGDFEYSLDGKNFQKSNFFSGIPAGIYTAFIKGLNDCGIASKKFAHIIVPKFITPNNDGYHDTFKLNGAGFYKFSDIKIFDRYGNVLKEGNGSTFYWVGKYRGKNMPSDDYWYQITLDDAVLKGHFSLKR